MSRADDREHGSSSSSARTAPARANAKLMRERLGSADTAAAARLAGSGTAGSLGARLRRPLARARLAVRRMLLRVLR